MTAPCEGRVAMAGDHYCPQLVDPCRTLRAVWPGVLRVLVEKGPV